MVQDQEIKDFYSQLEFPGRYTRQDLDRYEPRPNNRYLSFIYDHLADGQEVLDAGCGTGLLTNTFATRFRSNFTAVDFSSSVFFGQQFARAHGINNAHWVQHDLADFAWPHQFDIIICQGVLHHIPQHETVLHNLKSMLKPGGMLLLGLYNPWGKILKKIWPVRYHDPILARDQEQNPFELSWTISQVKHLCGDLEYIGCTPHFLCDALSDMLNIFNSQNGGLTLYSFRKKYVQIDS